MRRHFPLHLLRGSDPDIEAFMAWLIPPTAEKIRPEFWDTTPGQMLARAQWQRHKDEALTLADAARLLGLPANTRTLMTLRDHLPLYRKPKSAMPHRRSPSRKTTDRSSHAWYVLRSDVESLDKP